MKPKLISSAPELFAALERLYGKLLMSDRDGEVRITEEDGEMARAALEKARCEDIVNAVPKADKKSASMGWFFDPSFIQNVQRVAADIENPSMESIDSVLYALHEMGYIFVKDYEEENDA